MRTNEIVMNSKEIVNFFLFFYDILSMSVMIYNLNQNHFILDI